MPLSDEQLIEIRGWIGDAVPPSDGDLDDSYDALGGTVGVVRRVWSSRLADLIADPAAFSVAGEYSQSTAANMKAITDLLGQLSSYANDDDLPPFGTAGGTVEFYQLVRCAPGR